MNSVENTKARRSLSSIFAAAGLSISAIGDLLAETEFAAGEQTLRADLTVYKQNAASLRPKNREDAELFQLARLEALSRLALESFAESKKQTTYQINADSEIVGISEKRGAGDKGYLAIARDIARAHGGDIQLSDSPLGGLRASVRIPL